MRAAIVLIATFVTFDLACAAEVGDAPRLYVPQDNIWPHTIIPKALKTRAEVVALYRSTFVPGNAVPLAWSGSVAACDPGATNIDHQQTVITRVNYYRALVDLPAVALLTSGETAQEQAAALIMSANNALSHAPPTSWLCYSAAATAGAGTSNIALGARGVDAIDLYMDDGGAGNSAAGHRRWILFPPRTAMATGDVSGGNSPPRPANALYVFGPSGARPATPNGIAWPPAGFVPYENLPSQSNRWSISYPGADFTNARVTIAGPNGAIAVTYEAVADGFGDNTLVFLPAGFSYARPNADATYTITVTGLGGSNVPGALQYTTTVIDPDAVVSGPAATVDVVEYYNAVLDHYFITSNAAEIADLDAGRTPTRWTRTGVAFKTYASGEAAASPVCRYYIPPAFGDSHFFGRGTTECNATGAAHPEFVLEQSDFMYMVLPSAGTCRAGTQPIYRVFSNRADANHRYMIDRNLRNQMIARGWLPEGDGPDMVVMCAPLS